MWEWEEIMMRLACAVLVAGSTWAFAAEPSIEQRVTELEKIVTADPARQNDGLAGRVAELEKIVSASAARRDDGLAGRVEALEKASQKTPAVEVQRDLRRLEDRFTEAERRLNALERENRGGGGGSDRDFTELRRELQSMSRELTNLSRDIQGLDRRVAAVENRR